MEEWEQHVWDEFHHENGRRLTWCGKELNTYEFHFIGANHAALSVRSGNRVLPCPECAQAIIDELSKVTNPAAPPN